jgi:HEPN domain-containing protein
MKKKASKLFKVAAEKLNEANEELFRPKEDVVSYLVCKNSQYAIENYLRGYLYKEGVDASEYNTIESLYQQCKLINKKFENVDLSDFQCKIYDTDTRYCNEVSKVSNCFDIADSLDTFLRKEKIITC